MMFGLPQQSLSNFHHYAIIIDKVVRSHVVLFFSIIGTKLFSMTTPMLIPKEPEETFFNKIP
jgi:hypothetical protein